MRSYLEKQIPRLTKAVAKSEIPASQRRTAARTKKASAKRRRGPETKRMVGGSRE